MRMGVQSRLVLAKLGCDMRATYDIVLSAALPRSIRKRLDRLPGLHDVIDVRTVRPVRIAAQEAAGRAPEMPGTFIADDGGPLL
jgi:hypothetical protein